MDFFKMSSDFANRRSAWVVSFFRQDIQDGHDFFVFHRRVAENAEMTVFSFVPGERVGTKELAQTTHICAQLHITQFTMEMEDS